MLAGSFASGPNNSTYTHHSIGYPMLHTFEVKQGMLVMRIKRYNRASADILRKQLDAARIGYAETIATI